MPVYDATYFESAVEETKANLQNLVAGVKEALGLKAVGMANPSDEELASFFFHQQVLYPPETFVYPDGHAVTASPWILSLDFCGDSGKEWLRRFDRFVTKNGGM